MTAKISSYYMLFFAVLVILHTCYSKYSSKMSEVALSAAAPAPRFNIKINRSIPITYNNQKQAAEEIFRNFQDTEVRYGLLSANEQSGKTGTYHHLINLMMDSGLVDQVYILCGSNEIELHNQCENDVKEWHNPVQQANITVVFRQDFEKVKMNTKNTLIIVDESHLVQLHSQSLNRYLVDHKLNMAGTRVGMIRDGTYILSVDATPYAEESAMAYDKSYPKFKVILEDGHGYFGVKEYRDHGRIHATFNLAHGKERFQSLLQSYDKKYILVRCQGRNRDITQIRSYAQEIGCDLKYFTSKYDGRDAHITISKKEADAYARKYFKPILSLEDEPPRNTVIFLDGRLRCGKRVPKKHVGMVWESTKIGKTDIIRQGLLGRMCGYIGAGPYHVPIEEAHRPLIFVPEKILKAPTSNKVVMLSDLDRSIVGDNIRPRFANNIIPGEIQTVAIRDGMKVTPCVPIRFMLTKEQQDKTATEEKEELELTVKVFCLNALCDRMYLINNNRTLTPEQKEEIKTFLQGATADKCNLRRYRGTSNQNMHKSHVEAYHTDTSAKEHITGYNVVTFCVVYPGFHPIDGATDDCKPGHVYAIFYTQAQGYFDKIHKESRISKVNNKTHFTVRATDEMLECEGGGVYGFTPLIRHSAVEFSKQFEWMIKTSKESVVLFSKRITSLHNGEYIQLPKSVYGPKLEVFQEIVETLQTKYNTTITYEVKKQPILFKNATYNHELTFISWL